MTRNALIAVFLFVSLSAHAGTIIPYLVKDLSPVADNDARPLPFWSHAIGNVIFLAVDDQLWRTDGTPAGTLPIYDGRPEGHDIGFATIPTKANGFLYYGVETAGGTFLYKTDGTTPGTTMLAQTPSFWGGAPCGDGKVCLAFGGSRIGVTDGTPAGTSILLSTAPGVETEIQRHMTALGKRAFFNAYDEEAGLCMRVPFGVGLTQTVCGELWSSDGTVAGTRRFADLNPGGAPSAPENLFTSSAGKLYFGAAKPGTVGLSALHVPWVSDGTPQGTRMLLTTGYSDWSRLPRFYEWGGRVYFLQPNGDLYETDGTPEGTISLRERLQITGSSIITFHGEVRGRMLIHVYKYSVSELWTYDGTKGEKFATFVDSATLFDTLASTGLYYFATTRLHEDPELWSTDGTAEGTRKLFRLPPPGGSIHGFSSTPERLYYSTGGRKIFVTDGTQSGTHDIDFTRPVARSSDLSRLTPFGDKLLIGYHAGGGGIAITDGTSEGTSILSNRSAEPFIYEGRAYFSENSVGLWTTDGTAAGTVRLRDKLGTFFVTSPPGFIGDSMIFGERDPSGDITHLARRDQGAATERLGASGRVMHSFADAGDGVMLWMQTLEDIQRGVSQLVFTNGTRDGTRVVARDLIPAGRLHRSGNRVFFGARRSASSSLELWVSDRTAEGTIAVKVIPTETSSAQIVPVLAWRDLLIFSSGPAGVMDVVWRSDGTPDGTYPLSALQFFQDVLPDGDQLTLVRNTWPGFEIWTSDGTAQGTIRRVSAPATILSARAFALPDGIGVPYTTTSFAPKELFIRNSRTNEITVIDLGALRYEGGGAYVNGRFYFGALRPFLGRELWAAPISAPPRIDPTSVRIEYSGTAEGAQGRVAVFRVRMTTQSSTRTGVIATTVDGTLEAGRDYVPFTREIVFQNDKDVSLVVPLRKAATTGTMSIVLSSPINATITNGIATAQINDSRRRPARH